MTVKRKKLIEKINTKIRTLNTEHQRLYTGWVDKERKELEERLERGIKDLAHLKAEVAASKKTGWEPGDTYYKPKSPKLENLLEALGVLEMSDDEDIKLTPKLERALGWDFK